MKLVFALGAIGAPALVQAISGFLESCQDTSIIEGSVLWAECKNNAGTWAFAGLDLNLCLENNNGQLKVRIPVITSDMRLGVTVSSMLAGTIPSWTLRGGR